LESIEFHSPCLGNVWETFNATIFPSGPKVTENVI
jgi:hypothetical protein